MKIPDLHDLETSGVHEHAGGAEAIAHAATAAKLRLFSVDLAHADSKLALLDTVAKAMGFPQHFGRNYDALADCLEDDDVLGKHGAVVRIAHAGGFRKAHPHDWETLTDILDEAAEYWRERHQPFWVFVS